MPLTAKQVYVEVGKLKLLSPTPTSKGTFILDDYPSLEGEVDAASKVDDPVIAGRLLPSSEIYNTGAYRLEMKFSAEYPFKPPTVKFATPIYHLNVDKDGQVCLPIMRATEEWKANTSLADVVKAVAEVIDHPQERYAMNGDILKEYQENRAEYERKAKEFVKEKALKRP